MMQILQYAGALMKPLDPMDVYIDLGQELEPAIKNAWVALSLGVCGSCSSWEALDERIRHATLAAEARMDAFMEKFYWGTMLEQSMGPNPNWTMIFVEAILFTFSQRIRPILI